MQTAIENPGQPDVIQLINDLDAYQKPLYPPESHHGVASASATIPTIR